MVPESIPPKAFMPHPDVLPILGQRPPGWIGTLVSEGRLPIAICLKSVWHRHRGQPPTKEETMLGIDGRRSPSDYYSVSDLE